MEPLRNLFRHPLRFVMLWLAVGVGTFASLVVVAVLRSASLLLLPWIPPGVIEIAIEAEPIAALGEPRAFFAPLGLKGYEVGLGLVRTGKGVNLNNFAFPSVDVMRGYYPSLKLADGAWPKAGEALVPINTCKMMGCSIGGSVKTEGRQRYRVVGILRSPRLGPILAIRPARTPDAPTQWVFWTKKEGRNLRTIEAAVIARLAKYRVRVDNLRVQDAEALRKGLRKANKFMLALVAPSAAVGLFAAVLLIVFNFAVNRFERAKEVAIKRAMGASQIQIAMESLLEAVGVFLLSVPPVLILSWRLWVKVNARLAKADVRNLFFPEQHLTLLVAGFVFVLIILAAVGPALATARENPSARLKEE